MRDAFVWQSSSAQLSLAPENAYRYINANLYMMLERGWGDANEVQDKESK